jgi:hypothetical protein
MNEILLLTHVIFGGFCVVGSIWVFVDALNASEANVARIRTVSVGVAIVMWLSYIIGGYWYLVFYSVDKALILKGPWPFAHSFFMEMKEHVVMMLVLLATFLPIAAFHNLAVNRAARKVVLWVAGLIVLIGFAMEGTGAIIALGVKVALLPK